MIENAVTHWFGDKFTELHPLLQKLHQHGGALHGKVDIQFGKGLSGWIGKRLASKLGIPVNCVQADLEVNIQHQDNKLYWSRTFSSSGHTANNLNSAQHQMSKMQSIFEPIGQWPKGYWIERSGKLKLYLTVDVIKQGWHWRGLKTKIGWLAIPQWLLPRSKAWKRIKVSQHTKKENHEQYEFNVEFSLVGFGLLLRYCGTLDASTNLE